LNDFLGRTSVQLEEMVLHDIIQHSNTLNSTFLDFFFSTTQDILGEKLIFSYRDTQWYIIARLQDFDTHIF